ncbi:hypothetical protein [Pseudomonas aeruginosa]|uniref:hypothetical protein n=1 Tax=Pseudomonas aeruginosa TaxID=287 RepID=UPI003D701B2E
MACWTPAVVVSPASMGDWRGSSSSSRRPAASPSNRCTPASCCSPCARPWRAARWLAAAGWWRCTAEACRAAGHCRSVCWRCSDQASAAWRALPHRLSPGGQSSLARNRRSASTQ